MILRIRFATVKCSLFLNFQDVSIELFYILFAFHKERTSFTHSCRAICVICLFLSSRVVVHNSKFYKFKFRNLVFITICGTNM